jgi:YesN/AraC family two-component response regulator
VEITITDTGIGIPLAMQDKIFTNFFQVKSGAVATEGWGIGLALAKNIIDLHQGEISVYSEPALETGFGLTALTVKLRLGKMHFDAGQIVEDAVVRDVIKDLAIEDRVTVKTHLPENLTEKRHTVLVVEDNDELRDFIVQSLQHTYQVLESENGLKGLEVALAHVPDIVVSDVTMPELNGFELCQRLKSDETTSHIPVIMLTAMASPIHQVDGLEAGADVYITKPFSIQVLELSIRNLLQGREELKQKYIRQIMLHPRKLESVSPDEKFLNKLMQLIEDKMEDPDFNVGSLVDQIGMSQTVLYKKIKALTGLSITDFIKSQRLKRAAQLLDDRQMNIAEVAYAVGFSDRKYFSKEFRKQFGFSPSEYQQKQINPPF